MSLYSILVLNGPNLGHLGQRQPQIYGHRSMQDLPDMIHTWLGQAWADSLSLTMDQKNGEGELIDRLEQARQDKIQGIVFNAGAYTHTSLALADCLAWIDIPCIEVHLSNVWARQESLRHTSLIAAQCIGVVAGFGLMSYVMAILAMGEYLHNPSTTA